MATTKEFARPLVLLDELDQVLADVVRKEVAHLGGAVIAVTGNNLVEPEQFDLIVTSRDNATSRTTHVPTLGIGSSMAELGEFTGRHGARAHTQNAFANSYEQVVELARSVPDGVWPEEVEHLAVTTLLGARPAHRERVWTLHSEPEPIAGLGLVRPFLSDSGGVRSLKAGAFRTFKRGAADSSPEIDSDVWVLPADIENARGWFLAFVRFLWEKRGLGVFARSSEWRLTDTKWMSKQQLEAKRELDGAIERKRELLASIDEEIVRAESKLSEASAADEQGTRRLITSSGDDLVQAVKNALETLGFTVADMDAGRKANEPKLEDLRVSAGEWESIAEVKGYSKGAKVNDLAQVTGRPAVSYAAEEGRAPDRCWHIVNTFRGDSPAARPEAVTDKSAIHLFQENNGCLIDTRNLLLALRAVERGEAEAEEIRASMMVAPPVWIFDQADSGG